MSIPLWKQTILERKEKKKEEEKRKAAEAEQRRLDALPPWKRVIEERNVIIVSADKSSRSTPDVNVKSSDKNVTGEKHKALNKVHLSTAFNYESLEKEKNVDGVSEEHCSSVGDNPFLKLDRNRPRRSGDKIKSSSNGDILFQSRSKTQNPHFTSVVNILDHDADDVDLAVQLNTKSSTTKESKTLNQVKHAYNNSSDDLSECKFSNDNVSVGENDLADKKQLSVSELLGRFRSSSQENLLEVGLASPRESRSLQTNRAPRSKSLDRNTAKKLDSSMTTPVNSKQSDNKSSTQSFINSKHFKSDLKTQNIMSTTKASELSQMESYRPHSSVTIVSNSEYDMHTRKKKNKPDLSASELIDLGEDAPLSPLSTLSPFNFEIIESAHIQKKRKADVEDEDSFDSTGNRDVKTVLYNSNGTVAANKYKKNLGISKTSGNSNHQNNYSSKKVTNYVETNSSKSSGSNDNFKVPSTGMLHKHNSIQEPSPIPPPRNKKKKKAPKLDDVMKKEAHGHEIGNVKQRSALKTEINTQQNIHASKHMKNQPAVVITDVKTEHNRAKRDNKTSELHKVSKQEDESLKNENRSKEEDQLPVSNIDDIVLSPVKQELNEAFNAIDKGKLVDGKVNEDDGEKKKGIVKKITSVEFVGEHESSGKPSILKIVDDRTETKTKKSVKFDQQLSATFEYASEVSANLFFDEIESFDSDGETLMRQSDTNLTESSIDVNEDDIEHKSVDDGLKSNTSIGNKGLQAYVPSYLQNAYMSTIERRRNQDVPESSPTKEVIEDESEVAVPEPTSDLFSGWSSGNTAMLF